MTTFNKNVTSVNRDMPPLWVMLKGHKFALSAQKLWHVEKLLCLILLRNQYWKSQSWRVPKAGTFGLVQLVWKTITQRLKDKVTLTESVPRSFYKWPYISRVRQWTEPCDGSQGSTHIQWLEWWMWSVCIPGSLALIGQTTKRQSRQGGM